MIAPFLMWQVVVIMIVSLFYIVVGRSCFKINMSIGSVAIIAHEIMYMLCEHNLFTFH